MPTTPMCFYGILWGSTLSSRRFCILYLPHRIAVRAVWLMRGALAQLPRIIKELLLQSLPSQGRRSECTTRISTWRHQSCNSTALGYGAVLMKRTRKRGPRPLLRMSSEGSGCLKTRTLMILGNAAMMRVGQKTGVQIAVTA